MHGVVNGSQTGSIQHLFLEAATPDLYRRNAFRVTGMPTDAPPREIARRLKLLQMKAKLEGAGPDLDEIRSAAQLLQDSEQRFLHEIFWLWPEPKRATAGNRIVVAVHNRAVLAGARAADLEQPEGKTWQLWNDAATAWSSLLRDERFWDVLAARAVALDDPRLGPSVISDLRQAIPAALARIHAILAFRSGDRPEIARQYATWARHFAPEGSDAILLDASQPLRDRVTAACERLAKDCEQQPQGVPQIVQHFLKEVWPAIATLDEVLGAGSVAPRHLSDAAAEVCVNVLVHYCNRTEDYQTTAALLRELLPLACGEALSERICRNLETAQQNYKLLKGA